MDPERRDIHPKELVRTPETTRILEPRLIVVTGISATGKSTVTYELCKLIDNTFVLDKDAINQALLYIPTTPFEHLPPIEEYVSRDNVQLDDLHRVETPFGTMFTIDPIINDYYRRHGNHQTYLVMAAIAKLNMNLGKIAIVDCMSVPRIRNFDVRRFIEQSLFNGFPKTLIHFVASEEDVYRRTVARMSQDPAAAIRDRDKVSSREAFHKFVTEEQPMIPPELAQNEHLVINTSRGTPRDCALQCLAYITAGCAIQSNTSLSN